MPTSPQGTRKRSSAQIEVLAKGCHAQQVHDQQHRHQDRRGLRHTDASAIIGTASEPKPAPKPLLLTPSSNTAGIVTA
jgi:hypothetical protein